MKKKSLIITICVLIILIMASLITKYIDTANVSTGHEPECCIKTVSWDGNKVTYWGLGYKVVRYVGVSPDEPYESNIGIKMGSWFMNYEKPSNVILDVKSFGENKTFKVSDKADVDFITNLLKNSKYIGEPCDGIIDYAITYDNDTYNILIGCSEINKGGKQATISDEDMNKLKKILVNSASTFEQTNRNVSVDNTLSAVVCTNDFKFHDGVYRGEKWEFNFGKPKNNNIIILSQDRQKPKAHGEGCVERAEITEKEYDIVLL